MERLHSKYLIFFSFVLLAVSFLNCSSNNKIDKEKLAKIYVDKLIIEEQYHNTDSLALKTDEIFKKYSVTKDNYTEAIKSLEYDKEQWEEFFKFSKEYLDTLKAHLKDEKSSKPKSSKFSKLK